MNIFAVDDDPSALQRIRGQLAAHGHTQLTCYERADRVRAAIEADRAAADVLICDLRLPGMDGVELLRHVAALEFRGRIIIVSGADDRTRRAARALAEAHGLRVTAALGKPVSGELLLRALQDAEDAPCSRPRARAYGPDEVLRAIHDGQLVNHYHPKIDIVTGAVHGVECLVRWQHPEDGLVAPGLFVPIAEEHGFVEVLTRAVLLAGLRDARCWRDGGLALELAVNVSMNDLLSLEFPNLVTWAAIEAGVPIGDLLIEVAESRFAHDPRIALEILTRLHMRHIRLSIDDFGSGNASLAQLRDFPFDELKLSPAFVHGAANDPARGAIVEGTCRLARDLGLRMVAEGVQDAEDWEFLQGKGCTFAQGFHLARPMPAENVPQWCALWDTRRASLTTPPPTTAPTRMAQAARQPSLGSTGPPLPARRPPEPEAPIKPAPPVRTLTPASAPPSIDALLAQLRAGSVPLPSVDPRIPELQSVLHDLDSPIDPVLGLIRADGALTAAVIRVANSAEHGSARSIVNLRDACVRLGNRRVFTVVLETLLQGNPAAHVEPWRKLLSDAWRNARATALLARVIARPPLVLHDVELLAMLHNIGVVVLLQVGAARRVPNATPTEQAAFNVAVTQHHEEVGRLATTAWGLPPDIGVIAGGHRQPGAVESRLHATVVASVALAIDCGFPICGHSATDGLADALRLLGLDPVRTRASAREALFAPGAGL